MDVSELTKTLSEYSPSVNTTVNNVVSGTKPVALIIITIMFLIEMDSWWKYMKQEGGGLTGELWLDVAYKYILAYILVMMSGQLFDAILDFVNIVLKVIDGLVPTAKINWDGNFDKIKGIFFKHFFKLFGNVVLYIAGLSTKLIVLMRALEMYLLKAVSPLLIAFFMADSTRPIAMNVIKHFAAAAFQAVLVLLIVRFYPALVTDDLLKINSDGLLETWANAFAAIGKGIIFIILLWGSQRKAKALLGAM
ncbi:type IV secretion system protein [Streptococcus canis]|uniref:Type IV secretion system protein n=1 Tax=Streptococcus canis TaxID=1329 RepID=A0AAE4TRC9_STRCB|nr:type IV secretion system protein [Streptococcus canis]MDV5976818.1 type IV secretion system protein [Streptococcus canis]GMX40669.1 hypothetical protein ScKU71_18930 [Streptococcus canis]